MSAEPVGSPRPDRRALRRQQTISEILDIAVEVMTEDGVNGLSVAAIARRMGIQPPSLYQYFDSLHAIYDALFLRGMQEHLEVMRAAMGEAEPGLPALTAGLNASGRWLTDNRALGQLMFWRPVPSFEPSPEAFALSGEMVAAQREALADAVVAGHLGPSANDEDAVFAISILIAGAFSQATANEPDRPWGEGRFSAQFPRLMALLPAMFPA